MLRATPPGEDPLRNTRAVPVSINAGGMPPGENSNFRAPGGYRELENEAAHDAAVPEGFDDPDEETGIDFLGLVRQAETQSVTYLEQQNRRAWSDNYRAFHNEHPIGSKYTKPEWRARSKLFVPKTRGAIRKDMAAVAASLFNSIDAITCLAGNEGDMRQRANAALMTEIINYRTDRTSGNASFPWFLISMGSRQDAQLTGVCLTKQYWKQDFRRVSTEKVFDPVKQRVVDRDVYEMTIDRPDMMLIPGENYVIDPSADWTNPVQSSAYFIAKFPMQVDEVRQKQDAPVNPWNDVPDSVLRNTVESGTYDNAAIRRAREQGLDRLDETQTGRTYQIVWVYECFLRVDGEDYTFYSIGSQHFLTDPKPVREVYPEQFGERPYSLGYGAIESHRIFPMSAAESWQPLQYEINDIRNLRLDATKQNVMPIAKVRRGRQIDLDQVRRRSSGSSIFVQEPDDVTWETPPAIQANVVEMSRELDIEMDDLAGSQNYSNVQQNNALGKTLGGLKLAAGAANAVQEFDIRVWIETWAAPALAQIVRLEQYYESDPVVLGLCGEKAQLRMKYGVNQIDNKLLEEQITIRVSVGLGAGDPQQRLAKFQSAALIVGPMLQLSKDFQSGKKEIDFDAICDEVFGAAGYKDGGKRFFKENEQPAPNPMQDLKTQELQAKIEKDRQTGKAAMFNGLAALAKVALGKRDLEANVADMLLGHQMEARRIGFEHGHRHNDQILSAMEHGHRHGMAINEHRRGLRNDDQQAEQAALQAASAASGGDEGQGGGAPQGTGAPPQQPQPQPQPQQGGAQPPAPNMQALQQLLATGQLQFTRDPQTGRISGIRMAPAQQPAA